jgi:hypothetical protein
MLDPNLDPYGIHMYNEYEIPIPQPWKQCSESFFLIRSRICNPELRTRETN